MLELTITATVIKHGREEAGLTQDQLADMLHVSKQAVSNWERGKNLPDESLRESIEQVLHIKLHNEKMSTFAGKPFMRRIPKVKPLETIESIDDIVASVESIICSVKIDGYEATVKKMLYLTLIELLGYEIYYERYCNKYYSGGEDDKLGWAATAANLGDLIKIYDIWPLQKTTFHFRTNSLLGHKIEWMSYFIGDELFEDFDDNGYCDGFVQKIGRYGYECGHDLINLIPDSNTDLLVVYKAAILDIVEMLDSISSNEKAHLA